VKIAIAGYLLLLTSAATAESLTCKQEFAAESAAIEAKRQTLPALAEICRTLGVEGKCDSFTWMRELHTQTDQNIWYSGTSASPDNVPPPSCYQAVAIERYGMYDGGTGTEYACKVKPEDDLITDQDVERIVSLVHRLNSISPKTLADHQTALYVKRLVATLSEHQ
jgi:hypothetical protein